MEKFKFELLEGLFRYMVSAKHKQSKIITHNLANFEDLKEAKFYVARMLIRCTSHKEFKITDLKTNEVI